MKYSSLIVLFLGLQVFGQKEVKINSSVKSATVFFTGCQMFHESKLDLKSGKKELVFEKLTDFIDANSIQIKAKGDLVILGVSLRKGFEDPSISKEIIEKLNKQKNTLELKNEALQNEYQVLELDRNLLLLNQNLKGNNDGLKVSELKEAYIFMHDKLMLINKRKSEIYNELEGIQKEINGIEQNILSQRSKPVINYSEIVVEVDVNNDTPAELFLNYISPNATWKPYYDMRSGGIGQPIQLEAKALLSQGTGQDWKNIELTLSTNDPYENSQEPEIKPWYLFYNNSPQKYNSKPKQLPSVTYDGQMIRGQVIDVSTGMSMPFTKIQFLNTNAGVVTDFDGKFEIKVPKGERYLRASYVGYNDVQMLINSAYLKFFMQPKEVELLEVVVSNGKNNIKSIGADYSGVTQSYANGSVNLTSHELQSVAIQSRKRRSKNLGFKSENITTNWAPSATTIIEKKDLRMEYKIASKMSIPSDNMDYKVSLSNHTLDATYEYHCIPKIDRSVYLAAQVSGWEKLNLLNGESNIYFDGTYLGKSYLDASTTKDTLSFSFGKENKMEVERTRVKEKSRQRVLNNRQKIEIAWEIKAKNNGASAIPVIIKDQYPISNDEDIKVKEGKLEIGLLDEKTKIITWRFDKGIKASEVLNFDYSVDYKYGKRLYLE